MPYFEIEGRGKDPGRKRKPRTYFAKNKDSATRKAKEDGIKPDRVETLKIFHFVTTVAGCSHKNRDNTNRQKIVKKCRPFEQLILMHETGNRHDKHAIKVMRSNGEQVGYIPQGIAHDIIEGYWQSTGCNFSAVNLNIEQFEFDSDIFTLRIVVLIACLSVPQEQLVHYINSKITALKLNVPVNYLIPVQPLNSIEYNNSSGCLGVMLFFFTSILLFVCT